VNIERTENELLGILTELLNFPHETEWVEFKQNNAEPDEIGEYISALSNTAALTGKVTAWLVWGVDSKTHAVIGTDFRPSLAKVGNEELENWLLRLLSPKINFRFYTIHHEGLPVVLMEISAAFRHPVQFKGTEFIRVGTYKKKLKDFPEKERELWRAFDKTPFEKGVAAENVAAEEVLRLIDYPAYFNLLELPLSENRDNILSALADDGMIVLGEGGKWNITNMGAILFAKRLSDFGILARKAVRVIHYRDKSRLQTVREEVWNKGYATGFEGLMEYVAHLLPSNEVIGRALRKQVLMLPELAIRELVANAIVHQDFHLTGTGPTLEIFVDRMEITNPGLPLVQTDRFLDSPPRSRNEGLASFMRRIGVCEERGSGIDKVVSQTELYQLPAPLFETPGENTRAVLFAHRQFRQMDKADRVRACYLHACLRYVQRDFMTNTTLRERFGIDERNSSMVSRIIRDTIAAGLIVCHDDSVGHRARKYLPWWAK
jgi:ATP-dependent DNA helicase RecG